MFRQLTSLESLQNLKHVKRNLSLSLRKKEWLKILTDKLTQVPRSLKNQSAIILKEWMYQCECVLAQRLRRGQQMFCLYSKLWDERALKNFIKELQRKANVKGRSIVLGAIGFVSYDWQKQKITDNEIFKHKDDIEYIHTLKDKTVCNLESDKNASVKRECPCGKRFESCEIKMWDTWKIFIEQDDLIVWRRLHATGIYEYKVYGVYDDVTAEDFLAVQVDALYRKSWDSSAVELDIIESDPVSNSDILYWETQWPKFFANRDYVFNRRFLIDFQGKQMYLINRSTTHPAVDKKAGKFRIEDYQSVMVIKPVHEFNENGIEFSLTYYDNPGVNIPATVTTWVAMKAMPEFLTNLRHASKRYKSYCTQPGTKCYTNLLKEMHHVVNPIQQEISVEEDGDGFEIEDIITDNTVPEVHFDLRRFRKRNKPSKKETQPPVNSENNKTNEAPEQNLPTQQHHSYWRYLHPMYYFS